MRRTTVGTAPSLQPSDTTASLMLARQWRCDVVDYIRTMTLELNAMAQGADLELVAYFLDMARREAENVARQGKAATAPRLPER